MYKFSTEQVIRPAFLTKLVRHFMQKEVPRFQKLDRYYKTQNKILNRQMDEGKPNNKLAHSFSKYITNMATAYFIGKPIKYIVEDEDFKEALNDILKKNYINSLNFEIAKECSKKGIGYELLYINENGNLKTKKCSANDIIPVYSDKLGEFLECAIRIWTDYDIDGNLICDHANVYTNKDIIIFERSNLLEEYKLVDAKSHLLDDIPIIVYWNNEECSSDFEDVLPLIDAYDKSQSDTANDMEYFTDAYLCIIGAAGGFETGIDTEEDSSQAADELRKNRLLFLDEKGQAEWLTKNINDTAVENYKNRLFSNIFFLSQVPALTDESFAGNLTGVAIRYKLIGLEELAIMKENKFEAAQRKKIKMITAHLNMCMNKSYNPQEVTFKFERNFVDNVTELIENATKLEGITSKETQLNALPNNIVPDSKEEMERMEEERIRSEQLPMVTKEKVDDLFSETGDS